ncbi:9502_t:CDS:2, partial [Gigaspora margarita]
MSSQNPIQNPADKTCGGCSTTKKSSNFYYSLNDKQPRDYKTCENCTKKSKKYRKNQKAKKINILPNLQSSTSSHITFDNTTSISNCEGVNFVEELWDAVQYRSSDDEDNDLEKDDNNFRAFPYDLDEVHEVVAKMFEQAEKSNKLANFVFEVELDKDLLDIFDLNQQDLANITDLKIIKQRFQQLANIFIIPLESGSGKITLTIFPEQQYVLIQGNYNIVHEKPIYHQVDPEVYSWLCIDKLIDPEIHMVEQLYLEQGKITSEGFKVLTYIENSFVWFLGFLTSLFKYIGTKKATEIIIDFTFKTNQERFELFVVNLNCGRYSMPIAYLYLTTLNFTEKDLHNSGNHIQTRTEAIQLFFTGLLSEGLKPVFILTDKDMGQIAAAKIAWLLRSKIQL